jgi:aryl-alcohol dehydrogenase-like predicted oxidoreductase
MKHRLLGRTGLSVSELGLGGLFVSSYGADFDQARRAVRRAVELGIGYFDTAPDYGDSESVLGRILPELDGPLLLSTKLGGRPKPFLPQDRDCLMRSVEESLRLLRRDQVDILYIHEPDRPRLYDWWSDPERFYGPVCELLADLKRQGIIRATGLGGTTAYLLADIIRTGQFDVVLTAFNYSLLWREAELDVIPSAKEQGMGIVIGSPLQQGALARRFDTQIRAGTRWLSPPRREQFLALYALADEAEVTLPELALRFALSNPDVSCVLTGARSEQEVEENVAASQKGPLPHDVISRVDEIAARVPFRPFDEPACLSIDRPYPGPGPMGAD